jgi:hypothetical protein
MTNDMTNEFTLPRAFVSEMTKKLEKMNRKAIKLGMEPVTATISKVRQVSAYRSDDFSYVPEGETKPVIDVVDVVLVGNAPVISGYKFVATIDCTGEHSVIRRLPGTHKDVDLSEWYDADPSRCDHCNTNRRRNDVLILRNTDTDELLQIGRNCAADFFRSADAEKMVRVYALYASLGDEDDYSDPTLRSDTSVPLRRVLEMSAAVVRTFGWVSSKESFEEGKTGTKSRVIENLFYRAGLHKDDVAHTTADDTARAEAVEAWLIDKFVGKEDRNEFEHNVFASIGCGNVETKNFGYVIWAINGYSRDQDAQAAKAATAGSEFVGEVGKRLDFTARLVSVKHFDGYYGTKSLLRFVTTCGNTIIWWASQGSDLPEGSVYTFTATVKEHTVYREAKQTVVSRLKIMEGVS